MKKRPLSLAEWLICLLLASAMCLWMAYLKQTDTKHVEPQYQNILNQTK